MIAAHVFGTESTSPHAPIWECLSSVSAFSDSIVVHDFGIDDNLKEVVEEFSKLKRPIIVDTSKPIKIDNNFFDDEWIYLAVLDEVVHEDSFHYLWDSTLHNSEFLAVDVPIKTVFGTCNGEAMIEQRLICKECMTVVHFNGDGFESDIPFEQRLLSEHMPKPVWKFSWAFQGDESMLEYKLESSPISKSDDLPKSLKRFVGRYSYQLPYIKK